MTTDTIESKSSNGTWVANFNTAAAAKPYGTAAKTWQYVGGSTYRTFAYTPMPADLAGREVVSALLEVTMKDGSGTRSLTVQRHAKSTSTYAAMTYNNQPGVLVGSAPVTVTQNATNTSYVFDVSADLKAVSLGDPFYGWRIVSSFATQWGIYGWGTDYAITLTVELSDVPPAPSGLAPQGVTALAAPVFTWLASGDLISGRIQVDAVTGDFSAPLWDSGDAATTKGQLDSAALGWTGLANNASVLVRAQQTTDIGVSEWSDAVTLTRKTRGALVITSPGSTTSDPTPTVVHTFAGTQTRWQATLLRGTAVVADSGVQPGADTAWTPPNGATATGQVLTVRVRVWDDQDRTPSPGDTGYAEVSQDTTFTPGAIAGVDALSADQDGKRPWVTLHWSRLADVADEYLIVRDGVILDRVQGVVSGQPARSYVDWTCPPNTDVSYRVLPVTGGVSGASGPIAPVRTSVTGVWLVDPPTGRHFSISGDELSMAYGESSATYQPVGGGAPVKTTFALRGLEGTTGGDLTDYDGRTYLEQQADLFAMKANPTATYRLVFGDTNIPFVASDITTVTNGEQSLTRRIVKRVTFGGFQNGELPFEDIAP